jgi:hypothetical protein
VSEHPANITVSVPVQPIASGEPVWACCHWPGDALRAQAERDAAIKRAATADAECKRLAVEVDEHSLRRSQAERERDDLRALVEHCSDALRAIASGMKTSSGDVQGATWEELVHVFIARRALAATPEQAGRQWSAMREALEKAREWMEWCGREENEVTNPPVEVYQAVCKALEAGNAVE